MRTLRRSERRDGQFGRDGPEGLRGRDDLQLQRLSFPAQACQLLIFQANPSFLFAHTLQMQLLEPLPLALPLALQLAMPGSLQFLFRGCVGRLVERERCTGDGGGLAACALELDVQAQLVGGIGVEERVLVADVTFVVEAEERP